MKAIFAIVTLISVAGVALTDERTVIVPKDDRPFIVQKNDIVRLTGKGIAGSKIEVKVEGPAKVEAIGIIRELANGRPLLGTSVKEFDVKPTDIGKAAITITVTPPQPNAKQVVTRYEFEVN